MYFLFIYSSFIYLVTFIQLSTVFQNEIVTFMRLEVLKEPSVREIEGEKGYDWNRYHTTASCDICHHRITEGEDVYHCNIDAYDLCSTCHFNYPSFHPHPLIRCTTSSVYPPRPNFSPV